MSIAKKMALGNSVNGNRHCNLLPFISMIGRKVKKFMLFCFRLIQILIANQVVLLCYFLSL